MDSVFLLEFHILNIAIQPRPACLSFRWGLDALRKVLASTLLLHHLNVLTQSAMDPLLISLFLTVLS